jgi:hypothetical protein
MTINPSLSLKDSFDRFEAERIVKQPVSLSENEKKIRRIFTNCLSFILCWGNAAFAYWVFRNPCQEFFQRYQIQCKSPFDDIFCTAAFLSNKTLYPLTRLIDRIGTLAVGTGLFLLVAAYAHIEKKRVSST